MTAIAEILQSMQGRAVGSSDPIEIEGRVVRTNARQRDGQHGPYTEYSALINDGAGEIWATLPGKLGQPPDGVTLRGSGRVKQGTKKLFWDLRTAEVVGGSPAPPPAPPPGQGQAAQPAAGGPAPGEKTPWVVGTVGERLELLGLVLAEVANMMAKITGRSGGDLLPEEAAQCLATANSVCLGWENGHLTWPGQGEDFLDDPEIPF